MTLNWELACIWEVQYSTVVYYSIPARDFSHDNEINHKMSNKKFMFSNLHIQYDNNDF